MTIPIRTLNDQWVKEWIGQLNLNYYLHGGSSSKQEQYPGVEESTVICITKAETETIYNAIDWKLASEIDLGLPNTKVIVTRQ